jgi:hypothetical protein
MPAHTANNRTRKPKRVTLPPLPAKSERPPPSTPEGWTLTERGWLEDD